MPFFDKKTVGNLTSRLGADCQQVSQVIGNDLNLISRNLLQVIFFLQFDIVFLLIFFASFIGFWYDGLFICCILETCSDDIGHLLPLGCCHDFPWTVR